MSNSAAAVYGEHRGPREFFVWNLAGKAIIKRKAATAAIIMRLASRPNAQPLTGADRGAGSGAGSVLSRVDAGMPGRLPAPHVFLLFLLSQDSDGLLIPAAFSPFAGRADAELDATLLLSRPTRACHNLAPGKTRRPPRY